MDRKVSTEASPPGVPRTPYQPRASQRRKPVDPAMHLRLGDSRSDSSRAGPSPASPEVISSLITSLSVISKPASNHFEGQSVSMPSSPLRNGSFGVEYGAYSPQPLSRLQEEDVDLDELAASPPIVRTAKPPSGYSSLTAPKSPRRESSGGFKSLLRSPSRPSSKSSASSFPDDNASIGNLSVERGSTRSAELNHKSSHDSWGKRQSRSQKVLAYMSSREQLRASDSERKRASGNGADSSSGISPNLETLQFGTAIDEEHIGVASSTHDGAKSKPSPSETNGYHIPTRESSLKKAIASTKRSSNRLSHIRRRSDGAIGEIIPEYGEDGELRDLSAARHRRHSSRKQTDTDTTKTKDGKLASKTIGSDQITTVRSSSRSDVYASATDSSKLAVDDSAPFPSISSGSRRGQSADRRRSGRTTPEPGEALHSKRSSSRAKRLSAGGRSSDGPDKRGVTPEPTVGYERPQSADSIDGAVESYLCSPRLSQKIRHPQTGRIISFSEVGDAEGSAVFCCVGMGLTRYITAFYDELALTLKLRLITPDRPGVGDSEAYAGGTATPLSWPDDVYAICQALKITKFSILAHSAGAIYALATALRMPQHIRGRIHLLAPWIPPSQMNVFGGSQALPPANSIPTSQRILRALPTPFLKAANSSFMSATSSSITSSLPKNSPRRSKRKPNTGTAANGTKTDAPAMDKESFVNKNDTMSPDFANGDYSADMLSAKQQDRANSSRSPDPQAAILSAAEEAMNEKERQGHYDLRLTHAIWDLATTGANPAVDLLVCLERRHTIGFRYVDITRPVVIHHGSKDTRVPVENVRWLGKTMRRCEVRVLEGEGHGLMASATVMGSVLMEISKEWDDWNQVTGSGSRREEGRERGRSLKAGFR